MDESLEGLAWLLSVLTSNSTITSAMPGGVHVLQAPLGTPYPYGVITPLAGHDVKGAAGYRQMVEVPYLVRFWAYATQSDTLTTAINAADTSLQQARHQTTPSGLAEVLFSNRDHPLAVPPEWDGNALVIGGGGQYSLQIRAL